MPLLFRLTASGCAGFVEKLDRMQRTYAPSQALDSAAQRVGAGAPKGWKGGSKGTRSPTGAKSSKGAKAAKAEVAKSESESSYKDVAASY